MNNFEKIKAMDIDEFSEFMIIENYCLYCPYDINTCEDKDCAEGMKQWLLEECD